MLRFELDQMIIQSVVIAIRDLRRGVEVVEPVVSFDLSAEVCERTLKLLTI